MHLPVASHQISTSYLQALIGPSDEAPPASQLFDGVWEKCLDGVDWMSRYDEHPMAIGSLSRVRARVQAHNAAGRAWLPWSNVRGLDPRWEGTMAAEIALTAHDAQTVERRDRFIPTYIANVEPYKEFWTWRGEESKATLWEFVRAYRETLGRLGALWLWMDTRGWQLTEDQGVSLAEWLRACEHYEVPVAVLPETYWTDFGGSLAEPEPALFAMLQTLEGYGLRRDQILVTLPANADPDDMVRAIGLLHAQGLPRPNLWQRINLRPETAQAIIELADPWSVEPEAPVIITLPVEDPAVAYARGKGEAVASMRRHLDTI